MPKENLTDLQAFVAVAQSNSFTRAAAQLGLSRSALSHSMRGLEDRLGVKLLQRTTRSVSLTDAGLRLLGVLAPRLCEIEEELVALASSKDKPIGTVRITANDHCINTVLWPALIPLIKKYPDIQIEFSADYGFTDIVANRFDAGVRIGSSVNKDMIAVRIGPDIRMAVAASPAYLTGLEAPATPHDLVHHRCINLRLPTHGNLYEWDFEHENKQSTIRVQGQIIVDNTYLMLQGAIDGLGITYAPFDLLKPFFDNGQLVPLLETWWPTFPGYYLYYTSRRQLPPALLLVIEALRYKP